MKTAKFAIKICLFACFLSMYHGLLFAADVNLPKTVNVYVPAKAGGGTDVMARALANQISKVSGSDFVIINNFDGNGIVAFETIRNARPDGKNILQFHSTMILMTAMGKYKYNVIDDFTVIGVAVNPVESGYVFLVSPNAPYSNLKEFIDYAKKNPNKLLVGVQTGGSTHVMAGMLQDSAGIKLKMVEAGSDTEKLTALAGGNIDASFVNANQAKQYIEAGKLRALGVVSSDEKGNRTVILPDIPTFIEQGVNVTFTTMNFILGPKGMNKDLVNKFYDYYKNAAEDKSVDSLLAQSGMQLRFYAQDEGIQQLKKHTAQLTEAIRSLGLGNK
ncbi:MAG: Tripartite tricarboxylate transporter family receptor [Spirochaetes bacterium ADurb.Bin110]|nr:MAG: Tripartite tricarboxylate transporter family receptor [Spirochaetes bacterium ADurb.Bin110]